MDDGTPFGLRVHLLPDPPLWSWELIEPATHRVLRSSWNDDWMAYESPQAAVSAARASLLGTRAPVAASREDEEPQRLCA